MTAVRGTPFSAIQATATLHSWTAPTGILGGDLIFIFADLNANVAMTTPPVGFTQLYATPSTSSIAYCWWKIAAGTVGQASADAGATVSFTLASTNSADIHNFALVGGSASGPTVLASNSVSDVAGLATHATPSQAFAGSNKGVVEHVCDKSAAPGTLWTPPAGYTKISDLYGGTAGTVTNITALKNADTQASPAGSDTYTQTAVAAQAVTATIVLTPAVNGVFGGGGASVSDAKYNLLKATNVSLGLNTFESMADLEFAFYANGSGLGTGAKNSMRDHKKAFYIAKGQASGSIVMDEIAFMQSKGAVGTSYSSIRQDFYQNRSFV